MKHRDNFVFYFFSSNMFHLKTVLYFGCETCVLTLDSEMNQNMSHCPKAGRSKICIQIKCGRQSETCKILITEETGKMNILFLSFKEVDSSDFYCDNFRSLSFKILYYPQFSRCRIKTL